MRLAWLLFLIAIFSAETGMAQQPISPSVAQRLLRVTERFSEQPERMLEELDQLAQLRSIRDTDAAYVRREQAALLIREERDEEALALLQSTLADKPDDFAPFLRLLTGQLLLMEGDAGSAITQLRIWSQQTSNPNSAELSLLGYAYLQLEEFEPAAAVFEQVLERAEIINDQWYELLAYAYVQSGRRDEAIALLDAVIIEQPAEARWWRQLSNIYLLIEEYSAGAASLTIADLLEELDTADRRRLAGLFGILNMPAEGAELLQAAISESSEQRTFEDQMLLGELWMLARETDRAIAAFEDAQGLAADGEPALRIAQLHLQWERYDQASDALRLAADHYGEETPEEVWYLLAVVEINRDDLSAASQAIGRLDPEGAYAERVANLERYIQNRHSEDSR